MGASRGEESTGMNDWDKAEGGGWRGREGGGGGIKVILLQGGYIRKHKEAISPKFKLPKNFYLRKFPSFLDFYYHGTT